MFPIDNIQNRILFNHMSSLLIPITNNDSMVLALPIFVEVVCTHPKTFHFLYSHYSSRSSYYSGAIHVCGCSGASFAHVCGLLDI